MSVTIKDLRYKTKQIMQSLRRGEKPVITFRGRPMARLIPLTSREKKSFNPIGFGMWQKHPNLKNVSRWLDEQRKPRFNR